MELKQEIYSAFTNLSKICDQFFQKFDHFSKQNQTKKTNKSLTPSKNHQAMKSKTKNITLEKQNLMDLKRQMNLTANYLNDSESPMETGKNAFSKKQMIKNKKLQKQLQKLKQQKERLLKLGKKNGKKKSKRKLDPSDPRKAQKPKFPLSPYFRFLGEQRKDPQNKMLTLQAHKVFASAMGVKWGALTEAQKQPFISTYLADKQDYDTKLREFYNKYPDLQPRNRTKTVSVYQKDKYKHLQNSQQQSQVQFCNLTSNEEYSHQILNSDEQKQFDQIQTISPTQSPRKEVKDNTSTGNYSFDQGQGAQEGQTNINKKQRKDSYVEICLD